MAVAYRTSDYSVSQTGTVSVTLTGLTAGDLLLAALTTDSSAAPSTPSGWSQLFETSPYAGGGLQKVWSKVATATSETFTSSFNPLDAVLIVSAYSGGAQVVASGVSSGGPVAAGSRSAPSVTAPYSGVVVRVFSDYGSAGSGSSLPATTRQSQNEYQAWEGLTDAVQAAAGATGALSAYLGAGGWVASTIVLVPNRAPNAPTLTSPPTGSTLDRAVTQRFALTFSDPDTGDSQSALSIRYRLGAGAWVTVNDTTPNGFHDFAPGFFAAGSWEWQAQTTDQGSPALTGPLSASSFFTAADSPGVPSITAPTSGSTVNATGSVTWSVTTQTSYQVRKVADLAGAADPTNIYYDTGEVVDTATRTLALTYPVNNRYDHLQVRVKAAGLWSAWADCRVLVSWTAPMVPTVVCTPNPARASILIAVTNPAVTGGAPVTAYNDIEVSAFGIEYRAKTLMAPNSTWEWMLPGSGWAYAVRAVAVGTNGTTASSV